MIPTRVCTESELMEIARAALRARVVAAPIPPTIPAGEFQAFVAHREARRLRSLQRCHYTRLDERPRHPAPKDSGAFVPATAARIEDDRNLTDGARRCARKIMELTHRSNRAGRSLDVTVSYLAQGLGKCRRTVQRYLRQLEREGYIQVDVVTGERSRMCAGLIVRALAPMFPRHDRRRASQRGGKPDATRESQNKGFKHHRSDRSRVVPVQQWAIRCMDGVFRGLMKTIPPVASSELLSG